MPDQSQNQGEQASVSFDVTTSGPSKKGSMKKTVIALVIVLFVALGIFAGVLLVRQRQDIREKAVSEQCPAAEDCAKEDQTLLKNCTPGEGDNSPQESYCLPSTVGRLKPCGGKQYCCNGTKWTTSMSSCASPSPSASASSTASAAATATSTSATTTTATATATATSTSASSSTKTPSPTPTKTSGSTATSAPTKAPIPETGTGWPTYVGAGLGILVILGSLLLAL